MPEEDLSIALGYNPLEQNAPVVIMKGTGELAKRIRDMADERQIPVVKDEFLAKMLKKLPEGREIPENLYTVVSILFKFIYALEKKS